MERRRDIDGLRAVAVIPVLLFHFGVPWIRGGFTGVDIFFVISGFVIARSIVGDLDRGCFSLADFYVKRICRILPALGAVALATTIASVVILLPDDLIGYFRSLAAVGGFVSNIYFWRASGYFAQAAQAQPLLHTWSLAVEEQFYILAPLALALLPRVRRNVWLGGAAAVAAGSFALSCAAVFAAPTAGYFLLPTRAWELLLGCLIAVSGVLAPRTARLSNTMALAGAAMILCGFVLLSETSPFPGWNAALPAVGATLLIWSGTGGDRPTRIGRYLGKPVLVWIGTISYSLYLIHWPLVAFSRYLLLRPPSAIEQIGLLAASLLLAWFCWALIERPFQALPRRIAREPRASRQTLFAGATASLLVICLGFAGVAGRGFPTRFPDFRQAQVAADAEWGDDRCFNQKPTAPIPWNAERCTRLRGRGGPRVLLWGDSLAAHYVPGILRDSREMRAEVLQYTFAGCPPILAYYSTARTGCSVSNARILDIVRKQHVAHVIMAARWDEVPVRTLGRLHETIFALRGLGVAVSVIGPSPEFPADVQPIDYLSGQYRRSGAVAWDGLPQPAVRALVRAESQGASFIDPIRYLCSEIGCPYRNGRQWFYADYGHFTVAGSLRAVRAYFPRS